MANIAQRIKERDSQQLKAPTASGDHPFWIALETANQRTWIHGELVALGGDDHRVVLRGGYGGVGQAAGLLSGALAA